MPILNQKVVPKTNVKVVACVWEREFIQLLAALAVFTGRLEL